jgi:NIPSNAP
MSSAAAKSSDGDYYELRLYEMAQARLADFHDLMGRQVPPLFARHGVSRPLALWEGFAGPIYPLYGYLLRWSNLDDRMRAWGNFYSDPEWIAAMTANYAGEQRVESAHISFMRASPIWGRFRQEGAAEVDGMYELRRYNFAGQGAEESSAILSDSLFLLEGRGARILGVFDAIIGCRCPQTVAFIAWPNDPGVRRRGLAAELANDSSDLPRDSFLLRPARYGLARENFASHPVS